MVDRITRAVEIPKELSPAHNNWPLREAQIPGSGTRRAASSPPLLGGWAGEMKKQVIAVEMKRTWGGAKGRLQGP